MSREIERLESERRLLDKRGKIAAKACVSALLSGASEDDFAPLFAEIAERRKAIETKLATLGRRGDWEGASELEEESKTVADKLAAAVRAIETVLDAADADFSPAEKQALLSGIIRRVTPDGNAVYTTFKTGTIILICTNARSADSPLPCCAHRGGQELLEAFRAEFARQGYPCGLKISGSTCLTTCQHGPTVAIYPAGVWYVGVTADDVGEILATHLEGKGRVRRLQVPENVRVW